MENTVQTEPGENELNPTPIIGGFWSRLFAFTLDAIILGLLGFVIGTLFFDPLAELGGWGRLIGFTVALLYFGVLNSSIGNGQTIGKRILKIRVVDHGHHAISIPKSFLRATILSIPFFLNGALIPNYLLMNTLFSILDGLAVFFGGGSIIYLFIFNRQTRQSLHDLIVGTYVINTGSENDLLFKPIWKGHIAIVSSLFLTIFILIAFVLPRLASKEPFSDLFRIQEQIQQSGLVHTTKLSVGKTLGTNFTSKGSENWERTFFSANAVLRHRPADYKAVASQIASVILETYPKVLEKDSLVINACYGYDIGIASAWRSQRFKYNPEEWKKLFMQPGLK